MSVTFTADNAPTAVEVYEDEDGRFEHTYGVLDVNMGNANAARLCGTLDIALADDGWCGSMEATNFLSRVLIAQALEPADEGIPTHEIAGPGATMIDCGRRVGYIQERLGQLADLALWAADNGAEVSWG